MLTSETLVFSSQVFSIDTIKKAAYRFSDVLSVEIVPRTDDIECILYFLSNPIEEVRAQEIVADFRNEVLDQDLRSIVAKETAATRNAILAFALSKTGLQGSE